MEFKSIWPWNGKYRIWSKNLKTNVIKKVGDVDNIITDWAKNRLSTMLISDSGVTEIKMRYLAIGTGETAPTVNDTKLVNEVFRTYYVSQSNSSIGEITTEFYILDGDYVGSIKEIGIFTGRFADGEKDTGHLLSRALWNYTKVEGEEIYIERVDTIS